MKRNLVCVLLLLGSVSSLREDLLCDKKAQNETICLPSTFSNAEQMSRFLNSVLSMTVQQENKLWTPSAFSETKLADGGVFTQNTKLDAGAEKFLESIEAAESIAKEGDYLYASAKDAIYKINLKTMSTSKVYDGNLNCAQGKCSRPLGLRIRNGTIFCADLFAGLVEIDTMTGRTKILIPQGKVIDGMKLSFPNDLDVDWENNMVYMSDALNKWSWDNVMLGVLESDKSGRVIRYGVKTGEIQVVAKNIQFANGVQLTHDKRSLLVNEFSAGRVLKFALNGTFPAPAMRFTETLPGFTDNIRPSLKGGYWVALPTYSDGKPSVFDEARRDVALNTKLGNWLMNVGESLETLGMATKNEALRNSGRDLRNGETFAAAATPASAAIAELDVNGKVLQVLQSRNHLFFSEVLEHEDGIIVGSFLNHYLLKVPKSLYRA